MDIQVTSKDLYLKKDYGSASAYVSEVDEWCHKARCWMYYQQRALTYSLQLTQQYYSLINQNANLQMVNKYMLQP